MRTNFLRIALFVGLCGCEVDESLDFETEDDVAVGPSAPGPLGAQSGSLHDEQGIHGELSLAGCVVPADMMSIYADRLTLIGPEGGEVEERPPLEGTVFATDDPHRFSFSIPEAEEGAHYRLSVHLPAEDCGPLFWRSDSEGMAVGGGASVHVEGFAARTTVEILSVQSQELGEDLWVGRDHLDFLSSEHGTRQIRWRTDLEDVTAGELQISASPYPLGAEPGELDPCAEPEDDGHGVLYRETFGAEVGEWNEIEVDFAALLEEVAPESSPLRRLHLAGAPLYVRVVPFLGETAACEVFEDGVHGWVGVAKIPGVNLLPEEEPEDPPLSAGEGNSYSPPSMAADLAGRPTYGEWGYTVVQEHVLPPAPCIGIGGQFYRDHDPLGCMLLDNYPHEAGKTAHVGNRFVLVWKSSGGGGWSIGGALKSLVTTGGTALGKGVDTLSQLYESVKDGLAEVGADVINTAIPGACSAIESAGSSCEQLVKGGIEAGLMSMGIPPSLPNWEELKDEGIDYVAAEVGTAIEQQTGIPAGLTEDLLRKVAHDVLEKMGHKAGGTGSFAWVKPYINLYPAILRLTLDRNDDEPLGANGRIVGAANEVFHGVDIAVPSVFPESGRLTVPIHLRPRFDTIPLPWCKRTMLGEITCVGASVLLKPLCQYQTLEYSGTPLWHTHNCDSVNYADIYYRDAWLDAVANAGCVEFLLRSGMYYGGFFASFPDAYKLYARVNATATAWWDGLFYWTPSCGG